MVDTGISRSRSILGHGLHASAIAILALKSIHIPLYLAASGVETFVGIEAGLEINFLLTGLAVFLAALSVYGARLVLGRWTYWALWVLAALIPILLLQDLAVFWQAWRFQTGLIS